MGVQSEEPPPGRAKAPEAARRTRRSGTLLHFAPNTPAGGIRGQQWARHQLMKRAAVLPVM